MKLHGNFVWLAFLAVVLFVCLAVSFSRAADGPVYTSGTLLRAEACGENCYKIMVRSDDLVYIAGQTTTMPWNSFAPEEFIENGPVDFRLDKNKLVLKRPNGKEYKARLMKRIRYDANTLLRIEAGESPEPSGTPAANWSAAATRNRRP